MKDRSDIDFYVTRHRVRRFWKLTHSDFQGLTYREYIALLSGMVEELENERIANTHR